LRPLLLSLVRGEWSSWRGALRTDRCGSARGGFDARCWLRHVGGEQDIHIADHGTDKSQDGRRIGHAGTGDRQPPCGQLPDSFGGRAAADRHPAPVAISGGFPGTSRELVGLRRQVRDHAASRAQRLAVHCEIWSRRQRRDHGLSPWRGAVRNAKIVGYETSACVGCTLQQACPLFTNAALAQRSSFPCPSRRPATETVVPVAKGIVAFDDPPGVKGDGQQSGGRYTAHSVMTYHPSVDNGSWEETCILPGSEKDVCTAALNSFISWFGQR
jgi:hypothetical protein